MYKGTLLNHKLIFNSAPIGVFDSGVGGMSIAKTLMEVLPGENLLYLGDTEHVPYGKLSSSKIRQYTQSIIEYLTDQGCKAIVIACNTATAAVYDLIPQLMRSNIPIYNVIDPAVQYVASSYKGCKVGLLCTDLTHKLALFEKKFEEQNQDIYLVSFKASQLAHMIELEFDNKPRLRKLIKEYFFHHQFYDVEAVILGCTHYLWLKEEFTALNPFIDWVEPSVLIAEKIRKYLVDHSLLNLTNDKPKAAFCQTTDSTYFYTFAKQITPDNFQIEYAHALWYDDYHSIDIDYSSTDLLQKCSKGKRATNS